MLLLLLSTFDCCCCCCYCRRCCAGTTGNSFQQTHQAKVNGASNSFWREINDIWIVAAPLPYSSPLFFSLALLPGTVNAHLRIRTRICICGGSSSDVCVVVCYASSKFSINIRKTTTNKSNRRSTGTTAKLTLPLLSVGACVRVCVTVCACVTQASLPQSPQAAIALRVPSLAVAAGHHVILCSAVRLESAHIPSPLLPLLFIPTGCWLFVFLALERHAFVCTLHIRRVARKPTLQSAGHIFVVAAAAAVALI